MPGYGLARGHNYNSMRYDPMRADNFKSNNDSYSSLHYSSNRSYLHNNNHNHHHSNPYQQYHPHTCNDRNNHSMRYQKSLSNPYMNRQSNTSLHPDSNHRSTLYNPFVTQNTHNSQPTNNGYHNNHPRPDLTAPRPQPTVLTTPRPNKTQRKTSPNDNNNDTNGWNFGAFNLLKSVWSKMTGNTPKKKSSKNAPPKRSQSQPVHIQSTIPEESTLSHPISSNSLIHPIMENEEQSPSKPHIPMTPPQQTRPAISSLLNQTTTDISESNDDTKSTKSTRSNAKSEEAKDKVISIHNLLKKTRLSPNDALWLHSKIENAVKQNHEQSLSYFGDYSQSTNSHQAPLRASSQSAIIQSLHFDDSATENSFKSHHSIYSPLRINKANVIPNTSIPTSRYAPNPGSYHVTNNEVVDNNYNKKKKRKRSRNAVFNDEDDEEESIPQQRKRMRYNNGVVKSAYVRRKQMSASYLRPIRGQSTYKVPKYNGLIRQKKKNKIESQNENENEKKIEIESQISIPPQQIVTESKMITDDVTSSNEEKNQNAGFTFVDNTVDDENDKLNEANENTPLKKRKSQSAITKKRRSPLKPKLNNNCSNTQKITTKSITANDENDDDIDKDKEKLNDDNDEIQKEDLDKLKEEIGQNAENDENAMATNNLNEDQKAKSSSLEAMVNEDKNEEKPIEFPPKANDANKDDNEADLNKEKETKTETKPPIKRQETYMSRILRQRKVRYLAAYKKRIERVYNLKDPTKLSKVDGFIEKYSFDAEKVHELYSKICKKYDLVPCDLYEGDEHEKPIPKDEKEKIVDKMTTPEQTLSKGLTSDNKEETKIESTFKFSTTNTDQSKPSKSPFGWGASITTDESKKEPSTSVNAGFSWTAPSNDDKSKEKEKETAPKSNEFSWTGPSTNDDKTKVNEPAKSNGFSWNGGADHDNKPKEKETKSNGFAWTAPSNDDKPKEKEIKPESNGFSWTAPSTNDDKSKKEVKSESKPAAPWSFGSGAFEATPKKKEENKPAPSFGNSVNPFASTNEGEKDSKKSASPWNFGSSEPPKFGSSEPSKSAFSAVPSTPAKTTQSTVDTWGKSNDTNNGGMTFKVPTNLSFTSNNDKSAPMDSGMNGFGSTNNEFVFGGTSNDNKKPSLRKSSTEPIASDSFQFGTSTITKPALTANKTFSWGDSNKNDNNNKSTASPFSFGNNDANKSSNGNTSGFSWTGNNNNDNNNNKSAFGGTPSAFGNNTSGFGNASFNANSSFNNGNSATNNSSFGSTPFGSNNNNNNSDMNGNKRGWNASFNGGSNNGNNNNSSAFSFNPSNNNNNNNNNQSGNNFSFNPSNGGNSGNNNIGNGFFNMGGKKKRKVVKAKRRLKK